MSFVFVIEICQSQKTILMETAVKNIKAVKKPWRAPAFMIGNGFPPYCQKPDSQIMPADAPIELLCKETLRVRLPPVIVAFLKTIILGGEGITGPGVVYNFILNTDGRTTGIYITSCFNLRTIYTCVLNVDATNTTAPFTTEKETIFIDALTALYNKWDETREREKRVVIVTDFDKTTLRTVPIIEIVRKSTLHIHLPKQILAFIDFYSGVTVMGVDSARIIYFTFYTTSHPTELQSCGPDGYNFYINIQPDGWTDGFTTENKQHAIIGLKALHAAFEAECDVDQNQRVIVKLV